MAFTAWCIIIGLLLILMALSGSVLRRLPLSSSLLYLAVGALLGPYGYGLLRLDPLEDASMLERLTEIAVLVSLFSTGLKLSPPLRDPRWWIPIRLAFGSMFVTVALIAGIGVWGLGLPLGAAVLLGAVLAPTDPVLASDVQLEHPGDRDRLRFSLTGEGSLNDGAAFPFVMLGLGLLGLHGLGDYGWRWVLVDLLWATSAGLAVGGLLGLLVGRLVLYLRSEHKEAVGLDEFLTLGLIALSYGTALLIHSYGFLAVFAAGLALRRIERRAAGEQEAPLEVREMGEHVQKDQIATAPETAPAYMTRAMMGFNEQLERIGEVSLVLIVGGLVPWLGLPASTLWFIPVLFLVVRPVSVWVGLAGSPVAYHQRWLMSWFGIRGIGSLYYIMYAVMHGLPEPIALELVGLTLVVIATSVVVHGVTVTPLMKWYTGREERRGRTERPRPDRTERSQPDRTGPRPDRDGGLVNP